MFNTSFARAATHLGFFLVALAAAVSFGQAATVESLSHLSSRQEQTWYVTHPQGWTAEPWVGDDQPYQQLREGIDKAAANPQSLQVLITRYKAQAKEWPDDPKAVYAWAYAIWDTDDPKASWNDIYHQLAPLRLPLANVSSPHTYNYSRLRFLIESWIRPDIRLKPLGERLAQRDPKDFSVVYHFIQVMQSSYTPQNENESLAYAHELVRWHPEMSSSYSALGGVHLTAFDHNKKHGHADAVQAIAAYQQYLRLAPGDDPWRAQAETLIKDIHDLEAMVGTDER